MPSKVCRPILRNTQYGPISLVRNPIIRPIIPSHPYPCRHKRSDKHPEVKAPPCVPCAAVSPVSSLHTATKITEKPRENAFVLPKDSSRAQPPSSRQRWPLCVAALALENLQDAGPKCPGLD